MPNQSFTEPVTLGVSTDFMRAEGAVAKEVKVGRAASVVAAHKVVVEVMAKTVRALRVARVMAAEEAQVAAAVKEAKVASAVPAGTVAGVGTLPFTAQRILKDLLVLTRVAAEAVCPAWLATEVRRV